MNATPSVNVAALINGQGPWATRLPVWRRAARRLLPGIEKREAVRAAGRLAEAHAAWLGRLSTQQPLACQPCRNLLQVLDGEFIGSKLNLKIASLQFCIGRRPAIEFVKGPFDGRRGVGPDRQSLELDQGDQGQVQGCSASGRQFVMGVFKFGHFSCSVGCVRAPMDARVGGGGPTAPADGVERPQ